MKLIIFLLFFPGFMFAQQLSNPKPKFYGIIKAEPTVVGGSGLMPGGSVTFGIQMKKLFHVGAGAHYIPFNRGKDPYIPLFVDLSIFDPERKITPYFNVQAGYGFVYNKTLIQSTGTLNTHGRLFLSPGAGVMIGGKRKFVLTGNYINAMFKTETLSSSGAKSSYKYTLKGWNVGIGLKF